MDKAGVVLKRSDSSWRKPGGGQSTLLWDRLLTFSCPGAPSTYPCLISEAMQYLHSRLPLGQAQSPHTANFTTSLVGASQCSVGILGASCFPGQAPYVSLAGETVTCCADCECGPNHLLLPSMQCLQSSAFPGQGRLLQMCAACGAPSWAFFELGSIGSALSTAL